MEIGPSAGGGKYLVYISDVAMEYLQNGEKNHYLGTWIMESIVVDGRIDNPRLWGEPVVAPRIAPSEGHLK